MPIGRDVRDGLSGLAVAGIVAAVGVVVAVVVLLVGTFAFGWFSNTTADFRGGVDARNQTNGNGTYRNSAYDSFYTMCHQIREAQTQIDEDADPANSAGLPPQIAATNHQADLRTYKDLAAQYNAKAGATNTSGQFRSAGLPDSVPASYTPSSGEKVSCAY